MYANNLFEQNIIKNASQIIIIVFFMRFLNQKLSFTFRFRFRRSAKKFDFSRLKKTKIDFFVNNNINVNLF